jgi:hypothetical protein
MTLILEIAIGIVLGVILLFALWAALRLFLSLPGKLGEICVGCLEGIAGIFKFGAQIPGLCKDFFLAIKAVFEFCVSFFRICFEFCFRRARRQELRGD